MVHHRSSEIVVDHRSSEIAIVAGPCENLVDLVHAKEQRFQKDFNIKMSASKRVAVVTAAKLPLVRGLCKEFQGDVIITARDMARGKDMLNKLNKEGLEPVLHDLDNTDDASLQKFHNFLQKDYGGLDLLVNNAAIVSRNAAFLSFSEQVKFAMAKNFWGTSNICKVLFPLLRPHARVVNMLSGEELGAEWTWSQALRERFLDPELSLAKIEQLMKEFV
ncbi:hypothetical protein DPMN_173831, partial [Dreissena polymorpha]